MVVVVIVVVVWVQSPKRFLKLGDQVRQKFILAVSEKLREFSKQRVRVVVTKVVLDWLRTPQANDEPL